MDCVFCHIPAQFQLPTEIHMPPGADYIRIENGLPRGKFVTQTVNLDLCDAHYNAIQDITRLTNREADA